MPVKTINGWLTLIALVAFALGTFSTFHGILCFLIGTALILGEKYIRPPKDGDNK